MSDKARKSDVKSTATADGKSSPPAEKVYREPGLREVQTTSVFRVVNPELFVKPVSSVFF